MRYRVLWIVLSAALLSLAGCANAVVTPSTVSLSTTRGVTEPTPIAQAVPLATATSKPSSTRIPASLEPSAAPILPEASITATARASFTATRLDATATAAPTALPTVTATRSPFDPRVEVVADNVEVPWALAFAPDGRLFFTERPGRIRVIVDDVLQTEPVADLTVQSVGEGGLLGLVLDPAFAENGYMYVMYTYAAPGAARNRVSRLTLRDGRAGEEKVLLEDIPGERFHDGGRLLFGADGRLYVATGDARNPELAQRLDSLAGKILRMNSDGTVPEDNPYPNSLVYSLGHRNPQGLAWQPEKGILWSSEHGPSGEFGLCCRDEINRIVPGGNYGWPNVTAGSVDARYVDPVLHSGASDTWAPASAAFYSGAALSPWEGSLFYGALRGQHLGRVTLGGPELDQVITTERLYQGIYGRIRDVAVGPDGYLYFATSNRDGRARPDPDDDLILRIVP